MNKASSFIRWASHLGLAGIMLFVLAGVILSQDKEEKAEKAVKAEKMDKAYKAEYKEKHKEFCSNNWSNGDKISTSDLREMTIPATGSLAVDGGRNGGVAVKGENRSDVAIRACVQAWGVSDEAARAIAASIRIGTSGVVKADGPEEGWSVSYEARVPNNTNLKLTAHNGGISISAVDGNLEFETMNGGVSLMNVAGDVRGRTTNGGVTVSLSGNTWKGNGLDVSTTNGGVNLNVPESFAANIEASTVNGGFKSDIPALNVTTEDNKGGWANRTRQVNTAINGGGAPIKLTTKNGGVRIGSSEKY
ncbi:MAG: DUF4097 family beta strand repeat protein [Acidobacteria bacterium]|nr:DUF4097 family beta strand repeat protein [Acidobacteriota bacterium]